MFLYSILILPAAIDLTAAPLLPLYRRFDVVFERGAGAWLTSSSGDHYLDFSSGVAVTSLGHGHPSVIRAARDQLERLWHASNHYWTRPMAELALRLSERFPGSQAFFCNSGTEAVEAALKYARRATGRTAFVAFERSFHGRTAGSLAVTGQPAKRIPFEPLLADVRFATLNDAASLDAALDEHVACVLIEPIQGEGGVYPADADFVRYLVTRAHEVGALVCVDEVQTGVGRTGTFFAFDQLEVRPDLVTMAKGLANGLPLGALLVSEQVAGAFGIGDHATTFGGSPVPCAAACAVCDVISDELLERVASAGAELMRALRHSGNARDIRGRGFLVGVELERPAFEVVKNAFERGLLVTAAGPTTLRLTPPLIVSDEEIAHALAILDDVLR